jgi:tetratricopeptide (TPR) repeat protein
MIALSVSSLKHDYKKDCQKGLPVQLSLCMIVRDEAQDLPRCFQSVQGVVDEAIVVDTGSTDETIAIAQEHGATVHELAWQHDFAAARNHALQFAQGEWILVLDADEVLLSGCIAELKAAIQDPDMIAITLLRQELGAQQTPYSLVSRLFRRHPQLQFERSYHESIDDSAMALMAQEPHWKVGTLPMAAIAHEGYRPDAIASRRKAERAAQIMGQYLANNPTDAYICSKLGALYITQGRREEGLAILEQGLRQNPNDATTIYELHFHLGLTYGGAGQLNLARQHYETALSVGLPDVLKLATFINLAALYTDQGALPQAEALLQKVTVIQPDWAIAYYNLGLVYKTVGQFTKAISAYQEAIRLQPHYPEAHQNLGVVYLKLGQVPEGLAAFQEAVEQYRQSNPAEALSLQQRLNELGWQI